MCREKIFINHITDKIFKMLILREKEDSGETVYLQEYISDICVELNGLVLWSEILKNNNKMMTVISTITYLSQNIVDFKIFRREIFKMLNLLNKLSVELGGDGE